MKEKEYLLKYLLDKTADLGLRDDCAMDLADYDGEEVLLALYQCASDPNEDNIIQSSCGESLAEIMVRTSTFSKRYFNGLSEFSKAEFKGYLKLNKPEWLTKL
ncbi:MAG: hypothetical protein J0L54_08130 [Chitinophagales bacterium]|nr:hypothetical protein [Chitinophagales bacterium]